ncbi:MAG: acyl-CoA thioesterase [Bacteroidota bacterium]
MFEYRFSVRGYELDSYNHVNNAVYLNYFEQARWEIMRSVGLLEKLVADKIFLVITEINIRYSKEACLFDNILIRTKVELSGPYVIFKQRMTNEANNVKLSHAVVKTIPLNKDRLPTGVPQEFDILLTNNETF